MNRERIALMQRLMQMAGRNGTAGGFTRDGEAWVVKSCAYPSSAGAPDPQPGDVMKLWVEQDVLYAERRDGLLMCRLPESDVWEPA